MHSEQQSYDDGDRYHQTAALHVGLDETQNTFEYGGKVWNRAEAACPVEGSGAAYVLSVLSEDLDLGITDFSYEDGRVLSDELQEQTEDLYRPNVDESVTRNPQVKEAASIVADEFEPAYRDGDWNIQDVATYMFAKYRPDHEQPDRMQQQIATFTDYGERVDTIEQKLDTVANQLDEL